MLRFWKQSHLFLQGYAYASDDNVGSVFEWLNNNFSRASIDTRHIFHGKIWKNIREGECQDAIEKQQMCWWAPSARWIQSSFMWFTNLVIAEYVDDVSTHHVISGKNLLIKQQVEDSKKCIVDKIITKEKRTEKNHENLKIFLRWNRIRIANKQNLSNEFLVFVVKINLIVVIEVRMWSTFKLAAKEIKDIKTLVDGFLVVPGS